MNEKRKSISHNADIFRRLGWLIQEKNEKQRRGQQQLNFHNTPLVYVCTYVWRGVFLQISLVFHTLMVFNCLHYTVSSSSCKSSPFCTQFSTWSLFNVKPLSSGKAVSDHKYPTDESCFERCCLDKQVMNFSLS